MLNIKPCKDFRNVAYVSTPRLSNRISSINVFWSAVRFVDKNPSIFDYIFPDIHTPLSACDNAREKVVSPLPTFYLWIYRWLTRHRFLFPLVLHLLLFLRGLPLFLFLPGIQVTDILPLTCPFFLCFFLSLVLRRPDHCILLPP